MTRQGYLLAGGIVALGAIYGAGYWHGQHKENTRATQAEHKADVAKGEADALKRQAQAKDAEIVAKDAGLESSRAEVARKIAELAKLKASLLPVNPGPLLPVKPLESGVVDLAPLVAKQDEVINAQAYLIQGLETKIVDLTISRDAWKASEEARSREAAGLRIALEAQKSLTKGALWKGRFQGLAVGIGCGYLAGKI
jgi:hypothetical protein